jgi:hypothetical protein
MQSAIGWSSTVSAAHVQLLRRGHESTEIQPGLGLDAQDRTSGQPRLDAKVIRIPIQELVWDSDGELSHEVD